MTLKETMAALEGYGNEQTRKIYRNHGISGDFFGVKVGDMKILQKKIKKDHKLALELFDTKNADAQYFASLIADEKSVTKKELDAWAKSATWDMVAEYSVPWLAADSGLGIEMGQKWIKSKTEKIASCGWAALSSAISVTPDDQLDKKLIKSLLQEIKSSIHTQGERVKYTMNGFVIAVGCYVEDLSAFAKETAEKIGKVEVFMGNTACKVPFAPSYIQKVVDKNRVGKKRKQARC